MSDPLQRFREAAELRAFNGVDAKARGHGPRAATGSIDLASNDYLGLSRDPRVGLGGGDGRPRLGRRLHRVPPRHRHDRAPLRPRRGASPRSCGAPAALVFSSGYLANLAAVGALGGPGVLVVSDQSNHASLIDACRLSRSRLVVVRHRDVDAVERALSLREEPHAIVVTDAVFSVDGDLAPLPALHAVARRFSALLVVDEAHSLGVVGDGGRGAVARRSASGTSQTSSAR